MFFRRRPEPADVVADTPSAAPDEGWKAAARAAVAAAVIAAFALTVFVAVRETFIGRAAAGSAAQAGPTIEARQLDLASTCVRDFANYDSATDPAPWAERLTRCYPLAHDVHVDRPAGAQVATEPAATITKRLPDGLTVTVVVRVRVSGPTFAYYTVDVGCRRDGTCSLTTVPAPTKGL